MRSKDEKGSKRQTKMDDRTDVKGVGEERQRSRDRCLKRLIMAYGAFPNLAISKQFSVHGDCSRGLVCYVK